MKRRSLGAMCRNPIRARSVEQIDRLYCVGRVRSSGGACFVNRGPDPCLGRVERGCWFALDRPQRYRAVSFPSQTQNVSRWRIDGSGPVSRRLGNGYEPLSYSPDGRRLIAWRATTAEDPTDLAVLDAATGETIDSLSGWGFAGWSSDRTLIGARVAPDGTLVLERYDVETKTISASTSFPEIDCPDPLLWSESSRASIASGSHRGRAEFLTIDKDTMQRIEPTLAVFGLNYLSGSGDGDRVVVSSDNGIIIFDGQSGDPLGTIEAAVFNGTTSVTRLAVAPGGRLVAATVEGDVVVYDLETRQVLHTLSGTRGSTDVSVNGDGRVAMATGQDHSVTLYDVESGEQMGDRMIIPDTETVAGAVRPDGMELAMGGGFGRDFLVWDLDPEHWVTAACELSGRNLTQEEWATYIGDLAEYHETCPSGG